tara:strand:+ start:282 stop:701 length:420 start_codon:yes stop_codon:yes gene_type:complete
MSDFISAGMGAALEYGIDLKLESKEEELYYTSYLCEWFNENTDFKAYSSGEGSFEVELDRNSPILEVIIRDSVLYMIPYAEDIFEVFTLVLSFIAKKHVDVVSDMRGYTEEHKIESLNKFDKTEGNSSDDDDDDDYEWI